MTLCVICLLPYSLPLSASTPHQNRFPNLQSAWSSTGFLTQQSRLRVTDVTFASLKRRNWEYVRIFATGASTINNHCVSGFEQPSRAARVVTAACLDTVGPSAAAASCPPPRLVAKPPTFAPSRPRAVDAIAGHHERQTAPLSRGAAGGRRRSRRVPCGRGEDDVSDARSAPAQPDEHRRFAHEHRHGSGAGLGLPGEREARRDRGPGVVGPQRRARQKGAEAGGERLPSARPRHLQGQNRRHCRGGFSPHGRAGFPEGNPGDLHGREVAQGHWRAVGGRDRLLHRAASYF